MKNRIFLVAAILGLLTTACKKENPQNDLTVTPITISASYGVNDNTKVSYTESGDAITATWDAGDQLYVVYNGHVNTLTLSEGAGTASATFTGSVIGTPTAMSVLICYVRDANNPSAVEVSVTGEYTYTGGAFLAQDGTLASAAKCNLFYGTTTYGNGSNISCTFSPNTSMMKLTVFAPDGVSAGDDATLTYKSGITELAQATFTVGTNGINAIYLTVPAGEYTGTQTFVYHSGDANVTDTLSSTQACFAAGQTYSKRVKFGNAIPDGAIDGIFTINDGGDHVYFSQGNLQYNKTTNEWSFMEHQYDMVETDRQDVGDSYANQNIISLFGWGTSGNNHGAECYQPWSTSITDRQYYAYSDAQYNLYDQTGQADWGYNTIANGSTLVSWRTLTKPEFYYLLHERSTTSGIRWAKGRVNYVNGLILLPDTWTASIYTLNNTNDGTCDYNNNIITAEVWTSKFEANGAVFLPAAGWRSYSEAHNASNGQVAGQYWTSTKYDNNNAYRVLFNDTSVSNTQQTSLTNANRYYGFSVRLVCDTD